MSKELLQRFTYLERIVHWVVGATFVALLLTGLAFAYPSFFWLTTLVGGGPAARVMHPWIGSVFGVGMVFMLALWIRDMFLDQGDWRWLVSVRDYVTQRHDKVPPAGKYNAGQKVFFWAQGLLALVFVLSGLVLWMPDRFGSGLSSMSRLLHYTATLGGGLLLVLHVYLGAIAYPGTARGMIDGKVTRRWAALHHPRWHEDQTR
jgi:formate dehydrogenase subunit gamma